MSERLVGLFTQRTSKQIINELSCRSHEMFITGILLITSYYLKSFIVISY